MLNTPLMTEEDTARYLGIATGTLRNWRSLGQGPAYVKVGRYVRYEPQALAAWIKERTVFPG